jgi:ubiquinone/menaquinone biosynthesis C-methylase UbiE
MFSDPVKIIEQLFLTRGQIVADFGSGSGFYTLAAAKKVGESGRVYAIDVDLEMLRRLKTASLSAGFNNVDIMIADLEMANSTKIRPESLDLVIISNILFQLKNKTAPIIEAKRLLKKGGRLLLVDWAGSFSGMGPQASGVVDKTTGRTLVESTGLVFASEVNAGDHHYGLIFKK